jgi:NAD(P)-dependent dehydrogenase (short-subunit alcohol dehydrogenase family)
MIWGASGGMGRALARHLDHEGWTVLGFSRHPEDLTEVTPHAFQADVTDAEQVARAVGEAMRAVPEVDLWAYASGAIASSRVADMHPETWHQVLGANLTGAYLTTQASLPLLTPRAHLFYLGAYDERLRLPGLAAYAASKAALAALVDVVAKEQRRRRVTLVRPAAVDTPLWEHVPFSLPSGALAPETVAERIVQAYQEGHKGVLDL